MNHPTKSGIVFLATGDHGLAESLAHALDREQLQVSEPGDSDRLLRDLEEIEPRIALLDARYLGESAVRLCKRLRQHPATMRLPVIVLADAANVAGRIQALQSGADDSVSMPANVDELVARIRALPRRRGSSATTGHLHAGEIEMDLDRWTVAVNGSAVALTKKEFLLLKVLIESRGRALSRAFLLERVWSLRASVDTRTVDVHIGRLRRKLGGAGRYIITVRNVGFRFDLVPDWISGRPAASKD